MTIGLAYAMGGEIESILNTTDAKLLETVCGVSVYEIEPGLLAYLGGVGKVNAAMGAQLFIDRYHPDWLVNAGVAGSFLDLSIGTIVLADCFVQHDVDTTPMGDPIGLVSTVNRVDFPTSETERLSGILTAQGVEHRVGKVATGEVFMTKGERADWVARTFAPALCEMEGGAIAQVCLRNGVKFTALKSVSDRLCQENNAEEFFNYAEAMEKLNGIVLPFARALRDGK
ncbi:MAG: 5'-methylthioadenosine/S-adenosylhomocysteine nucleosidase [Lawsonibacter sp.]|nr:5'-methylthioadenosine/S-adenosylhomocysteine nucleosidase [Oscillospiraceae bacterium]MCI9352926.1 5'-methylthioadenosine/S-adenosylhomocysteine nucleosidase [Lawsonibacter sp.]